MADIVSSTFESVAIDSGNFNLNLRTMESGVLSTLLTLNPASGVYTTKDLVILSGFIKNTPLSGYINSVSGVLRIDIDSNTSGVSDLQLNSGLWNYAGGNIYASGTSNLITSGNITAYGSGGTPSIFLHNYASGNIVLGGASNYEQYNVGDDNARWFMLGFRMDQDVVKLVHGHDNGLFSSNYDGLMIASGGLVGIRTSDPAQLGNNKLTVNGNTNVSGNLYVDGNLITHSGRIHNITRIVTTPYTALASDEIIMAKTSGTPISVNLPIGIDGTHYRIANTGTSGNYVRIIPSGTELLLGSNEDYILPDGDILNIYYQDEEGWF